MRARGERGRRARYLREKGLKMAAVRVLYMHVESLSGIVLRVCNFAIGRPRLPQACIRPNDEVEDVRKL